MREKQKMLRVFINESDKSGEFPLYVAIIDLCREKGISGATVLRGIAGYGLHKVVHTDRLLRLSSDLPLVVEVVDSEENLSCLIPLIRDIAGEVLITMEDIEVVGG